MLYRKNLHFRTALCSFLNILKYIGVNDYVITLEIEGKEIDSISLSKKIEETFIREVMEETGYSIDIKENLGVAVEKKSQDNFIQYSTVFVGKILKKEKSENYTIEELKDGSSIVWVDIVDAIQLIKNSLSSLKYIDIKSYHDLFILKRDVLILECYAKMHNII